MNTPTASLHSLSTEIVIQEQRLLKTLPIDSPVNTHVTKVSDTGKVYYQKLSGPQEILNWLDFSRKSLSKHAEILRRVVNDAIRWARLGGEFLEVHFKEVQLQGIIKDCIEQLKNQILQKHPLQIQFKSSVHKLEPIVLDPFMIHVLFINLIDNAIKYSHTRGENYKSLIEISIERQTNLIDINISNWGLGIDNSDYDNIFSSFYRSSVRDRLHTVRGVGLGLATCKKIVTVHGGSIKVESKPTLLDPRRIAAKEGYQTTFTVRLPRNLPSGRIDVDMGKHNKKRIYI